MKSSALLRILYFYNNRMKAYRKFWYFNTDNHQSKCYKFTRCYVRFQAIGSFLSYYCTWWQCLCIIITNMPISISCVISLLTYKKKVWYLIMVERLMQIILFFLLLMKMWWMQQEYLNFVQSLLINPVCSEFIECLNSK